MSNTSSDYQRTMSRMRDMLTSGKIRIGERLPSERALAQEMEVSRPVVREVLHSLEMIGAVQIKHGSGVYASAPRSQTLSELFQFTLSNQSDILEIRAAIELHAVRLACVRATQSDYDAMANALAHIIETIDNPSEGWQADFEFHTAIVRASQSPSMMAVYTAISDILEKSHFKRRAQILQVPGIQEYLIEHHRRILHAVIERDAERAVALMSEHFEIGADFLRRALLAGSSAPAPVPEARS